jgi:hypothetical protein
MSRAHQAASNRPAKELVALARKCAKAAYPNPQREGCPDVSLLRAMAHRDRRYRSTELPTSHVVGCSPCFKQYVALRRWLFAVRSAQAVAVCVVVFAALFGGFRFVQDRIPRPVAPTVAHNAPSLPAPPEPQRNPPVSIQVNLAVYSPVRGDGAKTVAQQIHLPAKSLRITFVLPVGMEPTQYSVRVLDSAGKTVVEKSVTAHLTNGAASFAIDLNLEKTSAGTQWTMMIREPGLSWRKYPIMID